MNRPSSTGKSSIDCYSEFLSASLVTGTLFPMRLKTKTPWLCSLAIIRGQAGIFQGPGLVFRGVFFRKILFPPWPHQGVPSKRPGRRWASTPHDGFSSLMLLTGVCPVLAGARGVCRSSVHSHVGFTIFRGSTTRSNSILYSTFYS